MKTSIFGVSLAILTAVFLSGCDGGGPTLSSDTTPANSNTPTPSPAPAPTPTPSPPPDPSPGATTYYFSDCGGANATDPNAHPNCVRGDNTYAGTSPAAPKRDIGGVNLNALPAGTQLLFARGGVWIGFTADQADQLENLNVTPDQPLTFDAYTPSWGGTALPWLKTSSSHAVNFGGWQNTTNDGGYTFRNLKLDGEGISDQAFFLHDAVRYVTLENLEITGFRIGVHSNGNSVTYLTVRNSNLHHNRAHGMLGGADHMRLEGNVVADNNMDGGTFEHGFYLSNGTDVIVRNNHFLRNSAPGGVCNGGNLTLHGQLDTWLIEGNRIEQDASAGGCYGLSITTGYSSPEWFRNFTVRGNTVINVGNCAVCAGSAPNILVEDNIIINHQNTGQVGVQIPTGTPGTGDEPNGPATVRNNTFCFVNPSNTPVNAPAGSTVSGSTVITGSAATSGVCAR